ncbi:MAG: hypothetical protein M3384_15755 [Acidobacteriota bacterium]|nr:hypothetical protein [Acidobacteriota bacterium]
MKDWHLIISKIIVLTFLIFFIYMSWEMSNEAAGFIRYNHKIKEFYDKEIEKAKSEGRELTQYDIEKIIKDHFEEIAEIAGENINVRQNKKLYIEAILVVVEFRTFGTVHINRPVIVFFGSFLLSGIIVLLSQINLTKKITKPPFSAISKIADILPKKQCEILLQEISDARLEYYEAVNEKKIWKARCRVVFYYIGLGWSVVMWISDKVKEVIGIIPKKN